MMWLWDAGNDNDDDDDSDTKTEYPLCVFLVCAAMGDTIGLSWSTVWLFGQE